MPSGVRLDNHKHTFANRKRHKNSGFSFELCPI